MKLIKFIIKFFFNDLKFEESIKNKYKKLLFNLINLKISFQKRILIGFLIIIVT